MLLKNQFIQASGWGLVAAALCFLFTFLPINTGFLPFFFAVLLTILGLLGLRFLYGEQVGTLANTALTVGALGGIAGLVSIIGIPLGLPRSVMNFMLTIMFGGLLVFGLVTVRRKPMSRWNWAPLLAGIWWPAIWLVTSFSQITGNSPPNVPGWLSFLIFSVMSVSLAALGYVVQAQSRAKFLTHRS